MNHLPLPGRIYVASVIVAGAAVLAAPLWLVLRFTREAAGPGAPATVLD